MSLDSRGVLLVFGLLLLPAVQLAPAAVSADSLTETQQIKITATVLPMRYVIVNAENQIQQIISNSSDAAATMAAYQNSVRPENLRPLTPEIIRQASSILKDKTVRPGILYKRTISPMGIYDKKVLPLLTANK